MWFRVCFVDEWGGFVKWICWSCFLVGSMRGEGIGKSLRHDHVLVWY